MKIAGGAELQDALRSLAQRRPIFHSEADFQLAFAWEVKLRDPLVEVYLETRPVDGVHLDVAFERPDLGAYTAVELKYLTRAWSGTVNDQSYNLKNHGAQDIRAYDVVKDICRVEQFVAVRPGSNGAVIVISNDASYWRPAKPNDTANAAKFRIGEGTVMAGSRTWGPNAGPGIMRGRDKSLDVAGSYRLHWDDFTSPDDHVVTRPFRQLVIEIGGTRR